MFLYTNKVCLTVAISPPIILVAGLTPHSQVSLFVFSNRLVGGGGLGFGCLKWFEDSMEGAAIGKIHLPPVPAKPNPVHSTLEVDAYGSSCFHMV